MAPKRVHARKASASFSSPVIENHVSPSPPPMTLMGRSKKLSEPVRLALLPAIAMATSAVLYTAVGSVIDLQQLSSITREPELWRTAVPIATRIAILYGQWFMGFDAVNTFAVTLHIRLPFYFLLYLFYDISFETVAASAVIDATSCAVAFLALNRRRSIDYTSRASEKSMEARAVYDPLNVAALTGLATAVYATALTTSSQIPWFRRELVLNFDVLSLSRVAVSNLPVFSALSLPLGWSLREYLFGPATWADSKGHRRQLTHSLSNRTFVLVMLTVIETLSRTYTAIDGTTLVGAAKWASYWVALIALAATALVGAGAAAESEEYEFVVSDDEVELNEAEVVRERKPRASRA